MATIIHATNETYRQVEKLVRSTVRRFWQRYGGDFYDWLGESNLLFVRACKDYRPEKGKFSAWVAFVVYKGLLEIKRTSARRAANLGNQIPLDERIPDRDRFDLLQFLGELTEDAAAVARLILDEFPDCRQKGEKPKTTRSRIWEKLSRSGWRKMRIFATFNEIAHGLRG